MVIEAGQETLRCLSLSAVSNESAAPRDISLGERSSVGIAIGVSLLTTPVMLAVQQVDRVRNNPTVVRLGTSFQAGFNIGIARRMLWVDQLGAEPDTQIGTATQEIDQSLKPNFPISKQKFVGIGNGVLELANDVLSGGLNVVRRVQNNRRGK